MKNPKEIFRNGSKTYYNAAKLFPKNVRDDVTKLYSFVRVVDDHVDSIPQRVDEFNRIKRMWDRWLDDGSVPSVQDISGAVVKNMIDVYIKYDFEPEWVAAFFDSMSADISAKKYNTFGDLEKYVYGSAEVIGLMMCRIMRLDKESYAAARNQGMAMQLINFVRDIAEDNQLGRCYVPIDDMYAAGIDSISEHTARLHPAEFSSLVRKQIDRYRDYQKLAESGYHFLPKRLRAAVAVASDGYNWTAGKIYRDPLVVFESKLKPSKPYLLYRTIVRSL